MKRAQISFEFIVFFGFAFMLFIAVLNVFLLNLDRSDDTAERIELFAKEVKVRAITASLYEGEFRSEIEMPNINGENIRYLVYGEPDNMIIAYKGEDQVYSLDLPIIDEVIIGDDAESIIIEKTGETETLRVLFQ